MTTHRTRTRVSLAAILTAALTLGGCASTSSRFSQLGAGSMDGPSLPANDAESAESPATASIQFDNQADDAVRVYLVDEKRQWLLGRVERGANARLRVPRTALTDGSGWMRLSVVIGEPAGARRSEPRSARMATEPVAAILSQRWTFSRSIAGEELTSLPIRGH